MGWLGKSQGIFKLYDSDNYCGSYLSKNDAAEILDVKLSALDIFPSIVEEGCEYINELDLHKAWGTQLIKSPHKPRVGNATRSLDEIILIKLIKIAFPKCEIVEQIPFGTKRADMLVNYNNRSVVIEYVGPSHFIPQYQRPMISPLVRKKEIEDYFQVECVIWPYWIQRCTKNINAIFFDGYRDGYASVWSTRAFFGDFVFHDSASIILEISGRFGAVKLDGLGYMYGNRHTIKPIHPIVEKYNKGKVSTSVFIPSGNTLPEGFWLPKLR